MSWFLLVLILVHVLIFPVLCERYFLTENEKRGNASLIVRIDSGEIKGRIARTIDQNKTYYSFQSIPYAEPPVNKLRFQPPVPVTKWDKVLATDKDVAICPQPDLDNLSKMNEDCLFVNVYTPDLRGNRSVMVWIYGGFFLRGSARKQEYGPDFFINNNVVVVAFNYRVGVFGFISTQDKVIPGNNGLKDQVLALKWVKTNINKFGGNPNDVTIFGESAGSASVSYLLQTPLTKGLFHKAIMESGTSLCLWARSRDPVTLAYKVGRSVGVFAGNSKQLLEGLKTIDTKSLLVASLAEDAKETILGNPRNGLLFGPTIEPETSQSVTDDYSHEMLSKGKFHRVPLLLGYNGEEGVQFKTALDAARAYLIGYDLIPGRLVPVDMNRNKFSVSDIWTKLTLGIRIKNYYCSSSLGIVTFCSQGLTKFVSHDQFVRPINEYVRLVSNYTPTYFYRFSYEGKLGNPNRTSPGVGHSEELYYLFYEKEEREGMTVNAADKLVRTRMVKMWTNFAKTGNPTPENDPILQNITWPMSNPNTRTFLNIDKNMTVEQLPYEKDFQFWSDMYNKDGKPPFDTY